MRWLQGIGLVVPVLFAGLLTFYADFGRLVNEDLLLSLFLVGVISGALLRSWWGMVSTPVVLTVAMIGVWLAIGAPTGSSDGEIESTGGAILLWSFVVLMPTTLGAGLGCLIASAVRRPEGT